MAKTPNEDHVAFFPISSIEAPSNYHPMHQTYQCGACGNSTNGRVVCRALRGNDAVSAFCVCSCERREPTILIERIGQILMQFPIATEFRSDSSWPPELAKLYDEGAKSFAGGAYTAASMVCRKLLMSCACHEGAADDQKFAAYVDYITNNVLTFPKAKGAIDAIRKIGNEANHEIQFVGPDDAKRAMQIVTYMLSTIYSLPAA
jgi:hypothetical protein